MRLYDGWGASDFSTKAQVSDEVSKRTRTDFGFTTSHKKYNVVGLNATKIPDMTAAIDNWVKKMEDHINTIDSNTEQSAAFRDENVQASVREYIENVKRYCTNLISDLMAFSDKLVSVKNAYEENMAKLSGGIKSTGTGNATGEHYNRQFQ